VLWSILLLAWFVVGCTRIPSLVVWNNSSQVLTLDADGNLYHSQPNSAVEVRFPGNSMAISIKTSSNQVWRYTVRYPEKRFIIQDKIFVQIEPAGLIYLLPGAVTNAVTEFPPQSAGFPIAPSF